jgi:hypothetical protein
MITHVFVLSGSHLVSFSFYLILSVVRILSVFLLSVKVFILSFVLKDFTGLVWFFAFWCLKNIVPLGWDVVQPKVHEALGSSSTPQFVLFESCC